MRVPFLLEYPSAYRSGGGQTVSTQKMTDDTAGSYKPEGIWSMKLKSVGYFGINTSGISPFATAALNCFMAEAPMLQ
jgi:hypothetical protein